MAAAEVVIDLLGGITSLLQHPLTQIWSTVQIRGKPLI
jgi:hypothetical protein